VNNIGSLVLNEYILLLTYS